MVNPLLAPVLRWFARLSYPRLFLLGAGLFVADVLVPDLIPFADELLLGLGTLLLANRKRRKPGAPAGPGDGASPRR
ncbi:DUF6116 family protein [Cognatiluteimonas weifangensis]|uniref:Uncharacterized protein n=1 Tax=Cognatiluteimonas weifangensis TaxID=2303539 RepID=A0A372DP10_9GAMM|nr:DUF6116 family protein [Luteimonas weifangensis]RFP61286.1 hypothetical protein D0Y53_04875 [Luteimonas weifangensis]